MELLKFRKLAFIAIVLAFAAVVPAQEGAVTVTSETRWHNKGVDNAYMNKRIDEAAVQFKEYSPLPRFALFDIGYPKDEAEFGKLGGNGVLLVTALSQTASELPIKRVYFSANGQETDLKILKQISVRDPDQNSQAAKTFGPYRTDTLLLFPVPLRYRSGEVLIDFASGRVGMRLAAFDGSRPQNLAHLPGAVPAGKDPDESALRAFLKREYPGYLVQ